VLEVTSTQQFFKADGDAPRSGEFGASGHYLDEFTFRFNRRKSRSRGKLFFRFLQQAVAVDPVPYKSMVKCDATRTVAIPGHKI
jgi:hypothetical protein